MSILCHDALRKALTNEATARSKYAVKNDKVVPLHDMKAYG